MPSDAQLVARMELRIRDFEKQMAKANSVASKGLGDIERRTAKTAKTIERDLNASSSSIAMYAGRTAAAVSAALSVRELQQYADAWTDAGNKISATGAKTEEVAGIQKRLAQIAAESRSEFGAVVDLYTKLAGGAAELGVSQEQIARVTETVSKALTLSGASAQEAGGAIRQLGQALASGTLRGDELNSILEQSPALARLISKSFGVTVGELRKLGEAGKLESRKVFDALLKGSGEIDASFAKTTSTVSQAFTVLKTRLTEFVGGVDQSTGISKGFASVLIGVANNLDNTAKAAAVAGAALLAAYSGTAIRGAISGLTALTAVIAAHPLGALLTALAAATTALTLFSDQIHPIEGDLATLGDYAGVAFGAIKQATSEAATALGDGFVGAINLVTQAMSGVKVTGQDVLDFMGRVADGLVSRFVTGFNLLKTIFQQLPNAVADGAISAVNRMVAAIEAGLNRVVDAVNSVVRSVNDATSKLGVPGMGEIGKVDLGRFTNEFSGAGADLGDALGKAIADGQQPWVTRALQQWRDAANAAAGGRPAAGMASLGLSTAAGAPAARAADGKAGKTKAGKPVQYDEHVQAYQQDFQSRTQSFDSSAKSIEERTRALRDELEVSKLSGEAAEFRKTQLELENAAADNGFVINEQLRERIDLLAEQYATQATLNDQDAQAKKKQAEAQQELNNLAQSFARESASALTNVITGSQTAGEAISALAQRIAEAAIEAAIFAAISSAFGGGAGGSAGGGAGGGLGSLFASLFKADGGPVTKGQPYIVGERRPELFVPNESGRIVPRVPSMPSIPNVAGAAAGRNSVVVTQNFTISGNGSQEILALVRGEVVRGQVETVKAINQGFPTRARQYQNYGR